MPYVRSLLVMCALSCAPFDDGTVPGPLTEVLFDENALELTGGRRGLNTLIVHFADDEQQEVRFHKRGSYDFHDEWYYFRLLNQQPVPGVDTEARDVGQTFTHVDQIYDWARDQDELPYAMSFTADGERLVSDEFYLFAHRSSPKRFGAIMILHEPDEDGALRWVWRGSFRDPMSAADVERFFAALDRAFTIDEPLLWRTNSAEQRALIELLPPDLASRAR